MPIRRPHVLMLLIIGAALFLSVSPDSAWGRAGGGGSYGGGGGGGEDSDGSGEIIYLLIWLCVEHPVIGIPITTVVVILVVYGKLNATDKRTTRTIHRAVQAQRKDLSDAALAVLQTRDPDFDKARFLERMSAAFVEVQNAWSRQDLAPVRAFISDSVHQRFTLQLEMQKAEGIRNVMEDVRVVDAEFAAVYSDDQFDTIHVCFQGSTVDYNVSLETERRTSGSTDPEFFSEIWSFHRRPATKTLSSPGAIEGHCPNCAAPLKIVDRANCEACGSTVNSGEHDWVLAEITQVQEWRRPDPHHRVPGLDQMRTADSAFSVQHIEDRVSVMFYRCKAATFFNKFAYAAPILSEKWDDLPPLERIPDDEFWKDPAVGKVEVIDVVCGEPGGSDRVRVMVRWSGTRLSSSNGRHDGRTRTVRSQAIYTHVYLLTRRHGVQSVANQAFSSAACSMCGAPIAVTENRSCQFCGTGLVDGKHDWVLEDIVRYTHDLAFRPNRSAIAAEPSTSTRDGIPRLRRAGDNGDGELPDDSLDAELLLGVLARAAQSDGQQHPRERRLLVQWGKQWSLTDDQIQATIATATMGDGELPVPVEQNEAAEFLKQVIRITLIDGRITASEKRFLYRYATRMGYGKVDVRHAIAKEKTDLLRRAKVAKRKKSTSQATRPVTLVCPNCSNVCAADRRSNPGEVCGCPSCGQRVVMDRKA
jgi:DnaJ-domain-containing protein 1